MKKYLRPLILSFLALTVPANFVFAKEHSAMTRTLIKNVELIETPNNELYSIAIEDNKIVSVGKNAPSGFKADTVIDAKGKLATPGMVNTHNHVSMTMLRSYADDKNLHDWLNNYIWPAEAHMTADDMYWGAMLGITEMLKGGTTAFADMYFNMDKIAEACATLGIRANLSTCQIAFRPDAQDVIRENIDLHNKWDKDENTTIHIYNGPHTPYTNTDEYLKHVIAIGKANNMGTHMHLCETQSEVDNSLKDYGMTPIERMDKLGLFDSKTLAAHCVILTDNDRRIMAEKKVSVAHNPQSNLKIASGVAEVKKMLDAGINVGIGTDGCSSNNNLDMLEEIRLAAMLHKGVNHDPLMIGAEEAWKMGTINGAKAIGYDNLGELKEGQLADIVLWNMDDAHWHPRYNKLSLLIYAANSKDVDTVLVDGKIVVKHGKLVNFDEKKLYAEVDKHAAALMERIKSTK